MSAFVTISRDPNGIYVGCTAGMQIYFWSYRHEVWIPVKFPEEKDEIPAT